MADTSLTARTTIRLLESLVRLAQAHARIMCHGEVTLMDAVVAVTIIESSMQVCPLVLFICPVSFYFSSSPFFFFFFFFQLYNPCR